MAKASTTHVIEIETGIGEPAFIPLTLGQELQPISVGKKGMWRIESARVLDVHAFVYFDGSALFLQSADESDSASVDGYRVGKAWTELHAPCKIEIGAARLRFRSLLPGAERERPSSSPQPAKPDVPPEQAITEAIPMPKPGSLDGPPPGGSQPVNVAPSHMPAPPPHIMQPGMPPPHVMPPGVPPDDTRLEGTGRRPRETGPPIHDHTLGVTPVQALPQGVRAFAMTGPQMPAHQAMVTGPIYPGSMPPGSMPPMPPPQPMGMPPPHAMPGAHPGMMGAPPGPHTSGPYNSMAPYGMTSGQVGGPPPGSVAYFLAKYNELSPPKRILVILAPFCLVASIYLLFFDAPREASNLDAGVSTDDAGLVNATSPSVAVTTPTATAPPVVTVQCPPGFVPYPIPVSPGQAIPCVPQGTPMPPGLATPATADAGVTTPAPPPPASPVGVTPQTPTPPSPPPAPPPAPPPPTPTVAGNRTLERQAVDYVAANDYAHAAQVYEQLQAQNPQNRVYAEAARILRAKADAGAP